MTTALPTALLGLCALLAAGSALAASPDPFFHDRQLTVIIGFEPGGTYDAYARLIASHLPRHLSDHASMVPKNLPGAASFKAASYMANQAPRDGSVIGIINEGLVLDQLFARRHVDFDVEKFAWIGRVTSTTNIGVAWHDARARTMPQTLTTEVITGATSAQGANAALARTLNNVIGTKFKIILGYAGAADIAIAMERGELEAFFVDSNFVTARHRDWLTEGKVSVLVQFSEQRQPWAPDTPTVGELARSADEAQILRVSTSIATVGKAVFAPPGVPEDRLAILRAAFDETMRDPAFLDDIKQGGLDLDPLPGAALQRAVHEALDVPPAIADRAANAWNE